MAATLEKIEKHITKAQEDIELIKDNLLSNPLKNIPGLIPTVNEHSERLDDHSKRIGDLEDKNKKNGLITGIKVGAGTAGGVTVGVSWPKIWSAILSMWHSL